MILPLLTDHCFAFGHARQRLRRFSDSLTLNPHSWHFFPTHPRAKSQTRLRMNPADHLRTLLPDRSVKRLK